jgi:hypothetical protein
MNERFEKNQRYPIDTGYIVLRVGVNRTEYVKKCLANHTADIMLRDGTYFQNCLFSSNVASNVDGDYEGINFPNEVGELGSIVLVAFAMGTKKPIILSFLPSIQNVVTLVNENQSKSIRDTNECSISLMKDPKSGVLSINVIGKTAGKGKFNITVANMEKNAEVNIDVKGSINASATDLVRVQSEKKIQLVLQNKNLQDKTTMITAELGIGITIEDEFGNKAVWDSSGINLNEGDKGVAREDDEVTINVQSGQIVVAGSSTTQQNTSPITLKGTITKASSKVKAGN